jgi:TP53 regulating kinase and related kinases
VTRTTYLGRPAVRKTRLSKPYRHPDLDARLTARRAAGEARALLRLRRAAVRVPAVYEVDVGAATIVMEFVGGVTMKEALGAAGAGEGCGLCRAAGEAVRRMHAVDVCHGDLTTSNVLRAGDGGVVLIDFGLSCQSTAEEEKAVDLYVLERAIEATHPGRAAEFVGAFLDGYRAASSGEEAARPVLARLEEVRSRGRKRDMTG